MNNKFTIRLKIVFMDINLNADHSNSRKTELQQEMDKLGSDIENFQYEVDHLKYYEKKDNDLTEEEYQAIVRRTGEIKELKKKISKIRIKMGRMRN